MDKKKKILLYSSFLSGGGVTPVDEWILATGVWRDEGVWQDDDVWID